MYLNIIDQVSIYNSFNLLFLVISPLSLILCDISKTLFPHVSGL